MNDNEIEKLLASHCEEGAFEPRTLETIVALQTDGYDETVMPAPLLAELKAGWLAMQNALPALPPGEQWLCISYEIGMCTDTSVGIDAAPIAKCELSRGSFELFGTEHPGFLVVVDSFTDEYNAYFWLQRRAA